MMNVIRLNDGSHAVFSWTTGCVKSSISTTSIDAEAALGIKHAEAVINRLLLQGKEEEAERILEEYV